MSIRTVTIVLGAITLAGLLGSLGHAQRDDRRTDRLAERVSKPRRVAAMPRQF